jgi:hypothetical protein
MAKATAAARPMPVNAPESKTTCPFMSLVLQDTANRIEHDVQMVNAVVG